LNTRPSSHQALLFFTKRDGVEGVGIPSKFLLDKNGLIANTTYRNMGWLA